MRPPLLVLLWFAYPVWPAFAQFTPFSPAPALPSAQPGRTQLLPKGSGSDQPCPDGTSRDNKLRRCLPTQQGRTGLDEMPPASSSPGASPSPSSTALTATTVNPIAEKTLAEATEVCTAYPGTSPRVLPGGFACIK